MKKILYFLLPILTLFVLVNNVLADTIDVRYITDYTDIKLFNANNAEYQLPNQTTNSVISGIKKMIITINHSFDNDLEYEVELATPNARLNTNINKVSALGFNITCQLTAVDLSSFGSDFPLIRFKCPATTPYIILSLENMSGNNITTADNFRWNWSYLRYIIDNSISDATQSIITNDNTNTQNIINNNDTNTDRIIENNKENFQTCENKGLSYVKTLNNSFLLSGENNTIVFGEAEGLKVLVYKVPKINETYQFVFNGIDRLRVGESNELYTDNYKRTLDALILSNSPVSGQTYTINTTKQYIYFYLSNSVNDGGITPIEKELCTNKLDDTKNAINNLDDTIKDDSVDDNNIASSFEDFNDFLDDNSTITQLITLPITLYTAILNNINGTCSPFNLGSLFGTDLILPCINISRYLGSSLWNMIDIIISGFAIYAIAKKMIKVFNSFSSLREGDVIDD